MKIFCVSDIHGETKFIDSASEYITKADIVTITGDISGSGKGKSAEEVISCIEGYNRNILAVHGNWDKKEVITFLEDKGYCIHSNGRIIDGIGFFGVGGSNPTPMKTSSEYHENEIYEFLQNGFSKVKGADKVVLLSHTPPKNCKDRTFLGFRGGSVSIRNFLEKNAIDLCLAGHIHEDAGIDYINSCIVVNSGSFKKGRYSSVEINENINVNQGKIKIAKKKFREKVFLN